MVIQWRVATLETKLSRTTTCLTASILNSSGVLLVTGIGQVNDSVTVTQSGAESRYYTVKSGDTLSAISKAMYGSTNDYQRIFEANKPMLKHPDKIYPGQVLIIPAK